MESTKGLKKGDIFQYEKEIMFKGTETTKSKVVAVTDKKILLENGDVFYRFDF